MNKTFEFLKEKTQVNFVSTIDGDGPSCRPFGDPVLFDKIIFAIWQEIIEICSCCNFTISHYRKIY